MTRDISPAARALVALELIQNNPGMSPAGAWPVPAKPRADDRADRVRRRGAAAAPGLPDGRRGPGDGSRPVGRRAQAQPLVPAVLVTYQTGTAGAARGPDRRDRDPARHVHAAGRPRRAASPRGTGRTYPVDVLVYATVEDAATWLPRSPARLEPDGDRTRLRATTDDPDWYAQQLARIPAPFAVLGSAELRRATSALSRRLLRAAGARADDGAAPDQRNASGAGAPWVRSRCRPRTARTAPGRRRRSARPARRSATRRRTIDRTVRPARPGQPTG
jgi:hypothetical protein